MKFTHFYCTLLIVLFSTINLLSTPCYSSIVIIDPVYYIHNFWGGGQSNGINGIPGLNDTLKFPMGVTFSPSGDLYLVDRYGIKVYNMTTGLVSTVVGTGVYSNTAITEGQLANQTGIGESYEVAFHPITGELYYADGGYVRRVDSQGRVYSVAGTGQLTSTGDGGPALSATLRGVGISFSPEGELYIADFYNSVIRKIFTNGTIVAVCGGLGGGYNGDNIPANQAQIQNPSSIKYYKGDVYFSDRNNGRLRKISLSSGNISTIAYPTYGNDFVFNQYGDIFFAEMVYNRVRRFSKRGVLTSIAGDNGSSSLDDNIPALSASVSYTWGMEIIQKTNELFFSDFLNQQLVRKLTPTCPDNSTYVEGDCVYFCYGISSANATACSSIGSCIRNDTCSCPSGSRGNDCSFFSCDNNCNGYGKCIGSNTCQCNSGWKGNSQCSAPSCEDVNYCSGHGSCVSNNTCLCTSGWKGNLNCSAISCDGLNNCNGNGKCIGANICQCNSGWNGNSQCSNFTCEGMNNCSGHGSCVSNNTCSCTSGWKGNSQCSSISCDLKNNCNGNGQCIDSNTCQCNSGWNGNSECSAPSCEDVNGCSGHGSCISNNTCLCTDGWKGNSQCSSISCELLNNCNGNGQCNGPNSCQCNSGWKGNSQCSAPSCEDVNQCSGHGSCVSNNTCLCTSGWKGNLNCSAISCDGLNSCNGNGQCIDSNVCQCNDGWNGNSQCSNYTCENVNNCSGHGSCVSNNTCQCNSGWRGSANCSFISCDGLNNCTGHGSCVSNNTCSCNKYWRYVDCSINECLMSLASSDNQLSCSSSNTLSAAETFAQITTNTWTKQSLSLSGGNQIIKVSTGSTSSLDLSSNYFVSTSTTSSNSGFYTNVTNFMIQNSKSMLMNIKLSKPITYSFTNIDIDQTNYNFTCMRFNLDSNTWTNQDIETTISSTNQISCSTQYVSSVAIKRSLLERSASSTVSSGDLSVILIAILVPTFFLIMLFFSIAVFVSIVMYIMNRMKRKQNFSELPSQTNIELSNI